MLKNPAEPYRNNLNTDVLRYVLRYPRCYLLPGIYWVMYLQDKVEEYRKMPVLCSSPVWLVLRRKLVDGTKCLLLCNSRNSWSKLVNDSLNCAHAPTEHNA